MLAEGAFEERCLYIEHICANNRSNVFKGVNRRTNYLRISRAYFVIHNVPGPRTEFPDGPRTEDLVAISARGPRREVLVDGVDRGHAA